MKHLVCVTFEESTIETLCFGYVFGITEWIGDCIIRKAGCRYTDYITVYHLLNAIHLLMKISAFTKHPEKKYVHHWVCPHYKSIRN